MPREIALEDRRSCSREECLAAIGAAGFDPTSEESLLHAAGWLRRLGNDRGFLGDLLIERLTARHRDAGEESAYGPQVVMLSPAAGVFLRANIWPSRAERSFQASGGSSFVYELPHDHNFDFLTVGYFGPGYWSDYWEEDYGALDGWRGEPAGLRYVGRSRLAEGRLLHYRAHHDVHSQFPPDTLSVSLNVMHASPAQGWFDQYRFDVQSGTIAGILNEGSNEAFLRLAVGLGSCEAWALAESFAHTHPSDRMRLAAWDAQAGALGDAAARDEVWRRAELSGSRMVAMEATARREGLANPSPQPSS
ncbi:MAG: transposase [Candidatus Andeanibacterium colombiense]|uniref:Transposase n=1 Tax=Candidatus Andeanibacterium colombiense TaxID=3121345 RepID=A0AAJ5X7X4_9SPHN|nr:MAG: transposase [Sphingomonadaceae bacterium]